MIDMPKNWAKGRVGTASLAERTPEIVFVCLRSGKNCRVTLLFAGRPGQNRRGVSRPLTGSPSVRSDAAEPHHREQGFCILAAYSLTRGAIGSSPKPTAPRSAFSCGGINRRCRPCSLREDVKATFIFYTRLMECEDRTRLDREHSEAGLAFDAARKVLQRKSRHLPQGRIHLAESCGGYNLGGSSTGAGRSRRPHPVARLSQILESPPRVRRSLMQRRYSSGLSSLRGLAPGEPEESRRAYPRASRRPWSTPSRHSSISSSLGTFSSSSRSSEARTD